MDGARNNGTRRKGDQMAGRVVFKRLLSGELSKTAWFLSLGASLWRRLKLWFGLVSRAGEASSENQAEASSSPPSEAVSIWTEQCGGVGSLFSAASMKRQGSWRTIVLVCP